jgi:uncharacterized membrane protein
LWGHGLRINYPVLSWIGIIALGYCFGSVYKKEIDAHIRKKYLLCIGVSAIALFFIIRAINVYGDLTTWSIYKNPTTSIISFFNVTKYPPSLVYSLMTLGPCIIFLAFAEKPLGKIGQIITRFGRVPMFFYILHLYFIHIFALVAIELTGGDWKDLILPGKNSQLKGYGFSLWTVYFVWVGIVLILYPLCKLYDRYKTHHKEKWWLSYL